MDWDSLVTENENRLYRAALAILGSPQEAQDAVQDTFVKFLERAPRALESPSAWLMRVLVNRCRDLLRGAKYRNTLPLLTEADRFSTPGPEERQELEELYLLPPQDRAVIHLHYYEGWSTAEIAKMLRIREGTVRSRLSRARAKLKKLLEETAPED